MKKIAIYLRLSLADTDLGEDGKEESNSIENQRLLAKNFIESHEDLIGEVVEYKDDGYTGLNFDRPAFQQMITDAKRGIIGTIIVKDFSRFGRDYIGVGDYLEQILPSLGVRLIAVNSKYDSQEQGSNVLSLDVSINNMINNMYSKDLSKKLKSSFRAKWSDGKNPSAEYPFGYYAEKSNHHCVLRIDEEAAPTVRLIFELAIKGYSTKDIAEHLNKNEILTPNMYFAQKGKRKLPPNIYNLSEQLWNTSRVRNILKNYNYTGARVHGGRETIVIGSKKARKTPKSQQVIVENDHEAIVSKEDFEMAQFAIRRIREPQNWNNNKDVFSGKLKCGCCGCSLQLLSSGDAIYCQHSEAIGSKSKCNKDVMDRRIIISRVIYAIKTNVKELAEIRVKLSEQSKAKYSSYEEEVQNNEKKLKELSDELARYYEDYVNGNIKRELFIEMKTAVTEKRKQIEDSAAAREKEKDSTEAIIFDLSRAERLGKRLSSEKKVSDEIVDMFLEKVVVYSQNNIEVVLKTTDLFQRALSEIEK